MSVLLTGSTGFLGSYLVADFLTGSTETLALLVRSRDPEEAERRLWQALQLHFDFAAFREYRNRIEFFLGDVTRPDFGLDTGRRDRLVRTTDSVVHCAAALNRRSSEACMNVNLRGTLETVKMAQAIADDHGLKRFSNISTVAVSGKRRGELVREDRAIQWNAPDADTYGQTKKFAEHMVRRMLPEDRVTVFRPSAIIGDSRFPATTQFDMLRAFDLFARSPLIPLDPDWRIDIVPADYVSRAIVTLHQKDKPDHRIYHVSAGEASLTYRQILQSLRANAEVSGATFAPRLLGMASRLAARLAKTPPRWRLAPSATLIQVFLDHLKSNTVFDNTRIVQELGLAPAPFSAYARGLLDFARNNAFRYPYRPWPPEGSQNPLPKEEPKKEVA